MKHPIFWLLVLTLVGSSVAASADASADKAPSRQPETFTSPIRDQCQADLRKDHTWRAQLEEELRSKVHQADANLMMTNKKHVVMAYAALWIIVVLFVMFMWIRQGDLKKQIARLEQDIAAAEADEAKAT